MDIENHSLKHERYVCLDTLRGIAACLIAFIWHYQHLCNREKQPLQPILSFFYEYGWVLTEMFFVISGFVMVCGYKDKIANGVIGFREYIAKRYKRIYPLFLFTLIVVTAEQLCFMSFFGKSFVYKNFDLTHFVTNLLCVQSGWFDNTMSFNGPAWCISVELLCYIVFYLAVRFSKNSRKRYYLISIIMIMLGLGAISMKLKLPFFDYRYTARGLLCFFVGVLLYEVYQNKKYAEIAKRICVFALPLLLIFFLSDTIFKPNYNIWGNIRIVSSLFGFPVLIISSLMFKPIKRLLSIRPFAFLGKISTSIYLWHFPIQGLMMILHKSFGIFDFRRVGVMAIYIALSLAVATVSHIFLEKTLGKRISPIIDELFGVHKIKDAV